MKKNIYRSDKTTVWERGRDGTKIILYRSQHDGFENRYETSEQRLERVNKDVAAVLSLSAKDRAMVRIHADTLEREGTIHRKGLGWLILRCVVGVFWWASEPFAKHELPAEVDVSSLVRDLIDAE